MTKRVLIVDQAREFRRLLEELFPQLEHGHSYDVTWSHDAADALSVLQREAFDLVVLASVYTPGIPWYGREKQGLILLRHIRSLDANVPVIVFGSGDFSAKSPTRAEALAGGASAYVVKPIRLSEVEEQVALALGSRRDPRFAGG